jgi:hypothetical protein
LTGHYLLHREATVIFFSIGFLASVAVLWAMRRRYFPRANPLVLGAGALALGLANLAPVIQAWRARERPWRVALSAAVPLMLVGVGLMVYNAQRFGSPFEFGQRYQTPSPIAMQDSARQFSPRYLWFNFRMAFLRPADWSGEFPYVHEGAKPEFPKDYWEAEDTFGLLTNVPVVWLALAALLAWRRGPGGLPGTLRWFVAAVVGPTMKAAMRTMLRAAATAERGARERNTNCLLGTSPA